MRRNPFAPEVPCHRVIAASGVSTVGRLFRQLMLIHLQYIGGFKGDWEKAPSGINCEKKLQLLAGEGVHFDEDGMLADKDRLWAEFVL